MNRTWLIFIAFTMLLGGFLVYRFIWLKKPSQMGPPEQSTYQPLEGEGVITILYTGNTQSYLEPCGCYPGQSGGIARRATLVERIRAQDKSTLLVDAGGIFEGTNPLDQLRGKVNMEAMKAITYDAILLSPTELQFGEHFLEEVVTELQLPFISTNDPPLWQNDEFVQPEITKDLEENEFLILGASYLPNQSLPHLIEHLKRQILKQPSDRNTVILLSALDKVDNRQIVNQLKEIDFVISMKPKPRGKQYEIIEKTVIAYCTPQGETLGKIDLKLNEQGEVTDYRIQELYMDETVPDHPTVRSILQTFYDKIAADETLQALGKPLFTNESLEQDNANHYVGSNSCSGCHQSEFKQWHSSRHAFAFNTLLKAQKHFHPDCVSCHVVGFGYESGYGIQEDQDHFRNVGCETCHGPGGKHTAKPSRGNIRGEVQKSICMECHNEKHSPGFENRYEVALPKVDHSQDAPNIIDKLVTEIKQKENTTIELYAMSLCPFANEVKRQLIPILKRYKQQIDFKIFYIADDFGGATYAPTRFDSLHGIPEIWENVRQLIIAKYYPDVFLDYLLCYTKNYRNYEGWKECASRLGIDTEKVEQLTRSEEGFSLLSENIKEKRLSIQDSPTLIVNGTVYKSKDFGIQHCSSTQRSQSEYSEIVPILRLSLEEASNIKVIKFSAEERQYLKNVRSIVREATKTLSLTEMLKPDSLKMLEELEPIHERLTEMLREHPENPYLAILLGEVYRAKENSQQVIRLQHQMGFILNRDWLIIGPWPTQSSYQGLTAFNEVLPPEKRIGLNEKYKTVSKTSRDQWLEREVHWVYPDFDIVQSYVDLRSVLRTSTMACYALTYAKLPVLTKAQMRLGTNGVLKVWVNDKLVYLNPNQRYTPRVDEYIVPVELKKGLNQILVKIVQRGAKVTGFYLRLTDENGKLLDNIEIALPPEAKHLPRKHSMLWRLYSQKPK
ncbi:MAG: multiheme c-type cytochrome [Candidatus Poribacteria bacterium]|nr:multiheme c-type cytochrome [Candidatus Poribacteria bacterium]